MNRPGTTRRRTGYQSDTAIMERCPTNFAQTGGRTWGLIKIDGAPNELAQRPGKAIGMINTLSDDTGISTEELTNRYVNSINNLPLNPMMLLPSDPNKLDRNNIAMPYPNASRPRSVPLTAGQIARLGWTPPTALTTKQISKLGQGGLVPDARLDARPAPPIAPFASPVENMGDIGRTPILPPTITQAPAFLLDQIKPKRPKRGYQPIPPNLLPPDHPNYDPDIAPPPSPALLTSGGQGSRNPTKKQIANAASTDLYQSLLYRMRSQPPNEALSQAIKDAGPGATRIPRNLRLYTNPSPNIEPSKLTITDRNLSTAAMRKQAQLFTQTRSDGQSGSAGQGSSTDTTPSPVKDMFDTNLSPLD
tara:strand:- start:3 stop:1088 length:1086 start_codon:yes stop_codon:yes gene_type:complete